MVKCGLYFLVFPPDSNKKSSWILPGLFFGLAAGVKLTSGFVIIIAFIICLITKYKNIGTLIKIAGVSALALIPLLTRNAIATGNPFFPLISGIFPSNELSAPMVHYLSVTTHPAFNTDLYKFWAFFTQILKDSWLTLLAIPCLLAAIPLAKLRIFLFVIPVILATLWYPSFEYNNQFVRWVGLPPFALARH